MVYSVFSLESLQRGDSNEYTQYNISQYKKENNHKLSLICNYGNFSKGLKPAVVNEPSVFEPLKFYCTWINMPATTRACNLYAASKVD